MTAAVATSTNATRTFGTRHLVSAFVMGAVLATATATAMTVRSAPSADGTTPVDRSTTTATEQYRAWYGRPTDVEPSSTTATQQYRDWYLRPVGAGSTTATEQYLDWYLRRPLPASSTPDR